MTNVIAIHPDNPQRRFIKQVTAVLEEKGVIAYPTDSGYALGCIVGKKSPLERIRRIRALEKDHLFTLMCRDLTEIATYATINNPIYRLLRANTPGAYTFILPATKAVPKLLKHPKRRTIGLRIPDNPIALALLEALDEPMLSVSLLLEEEALPPADIEEVEEALLERVDLIVDGGRCGLEATSIIDLVGERPVVLREGRGDVAPFEW